MHESCHHYFVIPLCLPDLFLSIPCTFYTLDEPPLFLVLYIWQMFPLFLFIQPSIYKIPRFPVHDTFAVHNYTHTMALIFVISHLNASVCANVDISATRFSHFIFARFYIVLVNIGHPLQSNTFLASLLLSFYILLWNIHESAHYLKHASPLTVPPLD